MSCATSNRLLVLATTAGSLVILTFGLLYHILAAELGPPANGTPVDPGVLSQFPKQIGGWVGEDVPLDDIIVRGTGTDAHLNRRYSRSPGPESVSLYIGSGTRVRDLLPHRPEVCYIVAGWTRTGHSSLELPLGDGRMLPCTIHEFSRGALDTAKIVTLHYYVVDGQYCPDVSLLLSKAWRNVGTSHYATQVQIVASIPETLRADWAARMISDFAIASAPLVAALSMDTDRDRSLGPLDETEQRE